MQRIFLTILSFVLISTLAFAELKLKLPAEITGETTSSIINKNIEQNLKLNIPSEVVPPADMNNFVKGMILLGILADVSFPMGEEDGFKHIAGTAYSVHAVAAYLISSSFLMSLRVGYINFGTQTEEGSVPGVYDYKYEDTFTQIPVLLGAYYLFATGGNFKPYIGAAIGVFFQNYSVNWTETGSGIDYTLDESFSNTGFGVVPGLGFYYILGSIMLQAMVEYNYIFSELPSAEEDEYVPPLEKGNNVGNITQDEEESTEKASYISVSLGISFPLGQ
jgi:hypothetical protein